MLFTETRLSSMRRILDHISITFEARFALRIPAPALCFLII
jgi:hypothetical protein